MSRLFAQLISSPAGEFVAGGKGSDPVESFEPVDLADYARLAPARMSTGAWEYLQGAPADGEVLRRNKAAYQTLRLRPNVLVDVSQLDTRVTLLGQEMAFPIVLAPIGNHQRVHPEGELATARGAAMTGATWIVSPTAATSLEEIARATTSPLWFQLRGRGDRELTREQVERAQAAGCRALVFEAAVPTVAGKEITWLREQTSLPVLVKGIIHPNDAAWALAAGAQGLIISNQGATNPEAVPATIDALPAVAAKVAGRVPVLVEGGIRRGTDVLKALALGATAVLIGRPCLQGLALNGATGVAHVTRILRRELEMAMASTGRPTIRSIDDSVIWR